MLQGRRVGQVGQVGIDVVTDIILPADLPLDYHGQAIAKAMRDAGSLEYAIGEGSPARAEITSNGRVGLLSRSHNMSAVTVQMPDGRPLDAFAGVKQALQLIDAPTPATLVVLPKGRYRKTASYWFDGITRADIALSQDGTIQGERIPLQYRPPQRDPATGASVAELDWRSLPNKLCKTRDLFGYGESAVAVSKLRADETPWAIKANASTRVSIHGPNRRGPETSFVTGAAIKASFVPAVWARTHAEIDLPSCDSIVAAAKKELARGAETKPL